MQTKCKLFSTHLLHEKLYFCQLNHIKNHMKQFLLLLMSFLLLTECNHRHNNEDTFFLHGIWTLRHAEYPLGNTYDYPMNGNTMCHIYDTDSTLYECRLATTISGPVIIPETQFGVRIIDRGNSYLYLEDDDPRPLTIVNDTTIIIQRHGVLCTWVKATNLEQEWGDEILAIVREDLKCSTNGNEHRYIFSAKEREQASVIRWFTLSTIIIILVSLLIALSAITYKKEKQRLQLQLQQIQEVKENRPQSVRQMIETEENAFFASNIYHSIHQRISSGQPFKATEWNDIEQQLKKVYPGFISQIRSLYPMSELEYHVCLLIKLRIPPTEIAAVLSRDTSTISTVRSRLVSKVFGRKGGAKEWDDFIFSIGK